MKILAVKPAAEDAAIRHECEDGHGWTEQADGTVSPSYGFGGTHLTWPGYDDPTLCPEPERGGVDGEFDHAIRCPSCGGSFYCGSCDGPEGTTFAEQMSGGVCDPPAPACLKPSVRRWQWMPVKSILHREKKGTWEKYEGWTHTWVLIDAAGAPMLDGEEVREPTLF